MATLFTMKITPEARTVALQALAAEAPDYADERLGKALHSAQNRLTVTAGEAALLASALMDYAEEQLRDGSDACRVANDFANALGDVAVTIDEEALQGARDLTEAVKDAVVYHDAVAARADRVFQDRVKKRRDEVFRKIFLGGPGGRINIWGQIVTDTYLDPEVKPAPLAFYPQKMREKANVNPLVTTGPRRVQHLQGVVGTSPATQQAADAVDALGPITDHNTQMKVEGAEQLILDRNRGIFYAGHNTK